MTSGRISIPWDDFQLGFWHPFGPYTGLSVGAILRWKQDEVQRHGWTFWSFAYSRVAEWVELLGKSSAPLF